jgi:hypothetical protein
MPLAPAGCLAGMLLGGSALGRLMRRVPKELTSGL